MTLWHHWNDGKWMKWISSPTGLKLRPFQVGDVFYFSQITVPSGNRTWLAGKWTIEISDFPIKTSIYCGLPCLITRGYVCVCACVAISYISNIGQYHFRIFLGYIMRISPTCKIKVSHSPTIWGVISYHSQIMQNPITNVRRGMLYHWVYNSNHPQLLNFKRVYLRLLVIFWWYSQ